MGLFGTTFKYSWVSILGKCKVSYVEDNLQINMLKSLTNSFTVVLVGLFRAICYDLHIRVWVLRDQLIRRSQSNGKFRRGG